MRNIEEYFQKFVYAHYYLRSRFRRGAQRSVDRGGAPLHWADLATEKSNPILTI